MNKVFLISDIHFGIHSHSIEFLKIQEDYFNNFLIPILKNNKDSCLFILGDLFDNRTITNNRIINSAINIIKKIAKIVPIYILIGNHDLNNLENSSINSITPVKIFEFIENVEIIYDKKIFNFNNKKIYALSWIENHEDLLKEYEFVKNNNFDYFFCHTDFNGVSYNKFSKIENGIEYDKSNKTKIFTGHIHLRQQLDNLYVIGCPYHLNKGDIDNKKGIYYIDLNTDEINFIENNYSPEYKKIKYSNEIENLLKDEYIKNCFVEIEVNEEDFDKKLIKNFENYNARKIQISILKNEKEESDLEQEIFNDDLFISLDNYINSLQFENEYKYKIKNKIKEYLQ